MGTMMQTRRMVTDVDQHPVAWREAGEGDVIVFLHGLGGSRLSWQPQLEALASSWRCAAWDMPGYGNSAPLERTTFAALADAAAAWIGVLGGRAHVVAISFGGMIAQYLAASHPEVVRSLTLLATSPKFGLDGTRPDDWRAARLAPLDQGLQPAEFSGRVLRGLAGPHLDDEAFAGQQAAMARVPAAGLRAAIDCLITHDSRALLATVTAPTLVIVGELDRETPLDYAMALADGVPGARLAPIADAGHLLNVEAPHTVNLLIREHVGAAAEEDR
jgi:pimeloyl-ACP methyl ester carboxylesterase